MYFHLEIHNLVPLLKQRRSSPVADQFNAWQEKVQYKSDYCILGDTHCGAISEIAFNEGR